MVGSKNDSETMLQSIGVLLVAAGFLLLAFGGFRLLTSTTAVTSAVPLISAFVCIGAGIALMTVSANREERRKRLAVQAELGADSTGLFSAIGKH